MIQFSQKEEVQAKVQPTNNNHISSKCTIVPSQFKSQYLTILGPYLPALPHIKLLEMDLLKKGHIEIDRNHFEPKIVAQMVEYSSNYQAIVFKVTYGYYRTTISVLIVEGSSQSHNLPVIYSNYLNNIFTFESQNRKTLCIKCVQVKEMLHQRFNQVLNQVYLQKMAGILKIGPAVISLFGFDIVIYSDSIQFAMEKCQKKEVASHEDANILRNKLAIMHTFGLIHNDIKPSNIMISQSTQEIIFIDFGLSKHIKQSIGYKTTSRFIGTLQYCGPQMMKAYNSMKAQTIDLYYNDLICLNNSIKQLSSNQNEVSASAKNENENQQKTMLNWKNFLYYQNYIQKADLYFTYMRIKYMLFSKQMIDDTFFNQQEMRQQYFLKLCNFLEMLPKSHYSHIIQNLFITIQEKYGLQYFTRTVELRLPKILKKQPQIDFMQQSDQEQIYVKTIRTIYTSQHDSFVYIKKGCNAQNWLHNYPQIKQTSRENLIRGFCNYVDFRKTLSSFDEKVQASKQLLRHINPSLLSTVDIQQKCLVVCLRYLLMHFSESKQAYYQQTIPIMIRNLVMLNQIECSEITKVVKQVLGESIDTLSKFVIKIRLQLLCQWGQKCWYSPKNKLSQIISQIYHIKIQQPYFTILKQMLSKIFTFVSCTYTQIYNQVYKQFDNIYVTEQFIDQLIIWQICYIGTDDSFKSQTSYESLYLNKACLIGNFNRKYNYSFDFYYINLTRFRNRHIKAQFINQFYHRFQRCLQKTQLIQHFYIYYQYLQTRIMCNHVSLSVKQNYFLSVMSTLPPFVVQPQNLSDLKQNSSDAYELNDDFFKSPICILLLIQIYEFSRDLKTSQIPTLSVQLRRYFRPSILREVCPSIKLEQFIKTVDTKNYNSLKFISMIGYFYRILYSNQPFYPQQLSFYCQHVQTKLSQIKTQQDAQLIKLMQLQKVIVDCRCKIYNITKQDANIIKQYRLYLKKYLTLNGQLFIITRNFNLSFLTLIYKITLHLPSQQLQIYQWYYETVMKYRHFNGLFQNQKGVLSIYYINSYLLSTQQYSAFLQFHSKLSAYMSQFVYIDQIKTYILSLQDLRLSKNIPTKQLWVLVNKNFSNYVKNQDTYFVLLTSLILSMSNQITDQQIQTPFINKLHQWLNFISSKVQKAVYDAKLFVLQNVYSYLMESGSPAKVQITRNYVKYSKVVIKEGVFMKNMRSNLAKCHKGSPKYVQGISCSLRKWYYYATPHNRTK